MHLIRDRKTKMRPHNTDAFLFFIKLPPTAEQQ